MSDKTPFQRCYERTLQRCSSAAKAAGIEIPTEAEEMTTPERGLFAEITEAGRKHHWRMEWEILRPITDKFEQRLAEAETACKLLSDDLRNQLRITAAKEDERMEAHRQATQLRARCGGLEGLVAAVAKWFEDGMPDKDDPRANMLRVLNLGAALTATPQPAQEQSKCKNCGGKGWTWLAGAPAHETNKYPCEFCNLQEQTTK